MWYGEDCRLTGPQLHPEFQHPENNPATPPYILHDQKKGKQKIGVQDTQTDDVGKQLTNHQSQHLQVNCNSLQGHYHDKYFSRLFYDIINVYGHNCFGILHFVDEISWSNLFWE